MLKAPLLCDPLYGNPKEHLQRLGNDFKGLLKDCEYPFLHAKHLGFIHPITGEALSFDVARPQIFEDTLAKLKEEINE